MTIDVSQGPTAHRAIGTFRMAGTTFAEVIEATEFGVLQTADKWASFTARVRTRPTGDGRSVIVTVERTDPFVDGHPTTVTVVFDRRVSVTGVLQ